MIVISEDLALEFVTTSTGEWPLIGWKNVVTAENITADHAEASFPASNLANRSTNSLQSWRSDNSADIQYVTVDLSLGADLEYVGFVGHNFGSGGIKVTPQAFSVDEDDWVDVGEEQMFSTDAPHVMRFVKASYTGARLKLEPTLAIAPKCAVLQWGELLVMDGYGLNAGTVQIQFGRNRNIVTGRAYSGAFLGRIVTGGTRRGQGAFRNIDPEFFRENVDPFLEASASIAFFWVPDPAQRPDEVAYAWLLNDPQPPTQKGGYFDLNLELEGIL